MRKRHFVSKSSPMYVFIFRRLFASIFSWKKNWLWLTWLCAHNKAHCEKYINKTFTLPIFFGNFLSIYQHDGKTREIIIIWSANQFTNRLYCFLLFPIVISIIIHFYANLRNLSKKVTSIHVNFYFSNRRASTANTLNYDWVLK